MEQGPPGASYRVKREKTLTTTTTTSDGRVIETPVTKMVEEPVPIPLVSSGLDVHLDLEHRRKGLLWFPTYAVDFAGRYAFVNPDEESRMIEFSVPLGTENTVYDGFEVRDAAGAPRDVVFRDGNAEWSETMPPHDRREFTVKYRSRGTATWKYRLTEGTG